jgi:hypothetical protein
LGEHDGDLDEGERETLRRVFLLSATTSLLCRRRVAAGLLLPHYFIILTQSIPISVPTLNQFTFFLEHLREKSLPKSCRGSALPFNYHLFTPIQYCSAPAPARQAASTQPTCATMHRRARGNGTAIYPSQSIRKRSTWRLNLFTGFQRSFVRPRRRVIARPSGGGLHNRFAYPSTDHDRGFSARRSSTKTMRTRSQTHT